MKNNQRESDRFIEALEAERAEALSYEEQQIHKLGQELRELAGSEMPETNELLREQLVMKLGDQGRVGESSETQTHDPKIVQSESRLGWKLAVAACLFLAIGIGALMVPRGLEDEQVARGTSWARPEGAVTKVTKSSAEDGLVVVPDSQGVTPVIVADSNESFGDDLLGQEVASAPAMGREAIQRDEESVGLSYSIADVDSLNQIVTDVQQLGVPKATSHAPSSRGGTSKKESEAKYGVQGAMAGKTVQRTNRNKFRDVGIAGQTSTGPTKEAALAERYKSTNGVVTQSDFAIAGEKQVSNLALVPEQSLAMSRAQQQAAPKNLSFYVQPAKQPPSRFQPTDVGGIAGISGGGGMGGGGGGAVLGMESQTVLGGAVVAPGGGSESLGRRLVRPGAVGGRYEHGTETERYSFYRRHRAPIYYESPSSEQYEPITENEFCKVDGSQALSTFSIDVDTASYSNMRRFLQGGRRPPRNAVRIEELVNYFDYDYPQPKGDEPFAVNMEIANCPWNEKHHLLRVALKGKEIHRSERAATNLVFLLDVSGSMQDQSKLPLLKQGLMMMVQQLTENDSVSIVTYAGNAGVVLEPTNGDNKRQIEKAIEKLNAGGSTNGSAGIEMAYELAQKQFINGGSNRVILATDGDLNVGVTDDSALVELIKRKASEGVFLTVLGFGTGNLKDGKLEKLADNGNGMYAYIDSFREAHKVLIEQMSGSLETIAKDVKIQIEFNPGEVRSYRLIGYENRVLAAKDFNDDKKDAGEIGAGHCVTALYELELTSAVEQTASVKNLKYQSSDDTEAEKPVEPKTSNGQHSGELLTLALRYKKPDAQESNRIEFVLKDEPTSFSGASGEFRFAAAVASFGMILRGSQHQGQTSCRWVEETASRAIGEDVGGYRAEFIDLVRRAGGTR